MLVGDGRVELLAALGDDTPVGKFLAKRGPGMHHVAFETEDLPAALDVVEAAGGELIDKQPHRGLYGMQVAFVPIRTPSRACSWSWSAMVDDRTRIEIAFEVRRRDRRARLRRQRGCARARA